MKRVPLLDLGNVIVQLDWTPFFDFLVQKSGAENQMDVQVFLRSSLLYDFEFGSIGASEFIARMGNLYKTKFHEDEFMQKFCAIFAGPVAGMPEVLAELASRGPLYCLSNTNEVHLSYIKGRFPEMSYFTKIFASHEIKRRKPYPGVYRAVTTELNLAPRDFIFFDDVLANVEGARRAGLEAHLFIDANQVKHLQAVAPEQAASNTA